MDLINELNQVVLVVWHICYLMVEYCIANLVAKMGASNELRPPTQNPHFDNSSMRN